uniref:tRNA-splicing endonuclease subunit Sen34 n=1 Tax=Timema tahoe TaxID=61484 RepID=A0A7R9IM30_9NEOP|nr:unnamed protein product [Timema tahoe]
MIKLNKIDNNTFVWNANDWQKLREEHRIVGQLIGTLAHLPRQEVFPGLPLSLINEEVTLLIEKNIATLVRYPSLSRIPGDGVKKEFEKFRKRMHKEQVECCIEERKRQIADMIDRIVEGKRRKLLGLNTKRRKKYSSTKCETSEDQEKLSATQSFNTTHGHNMNSFSEAAIRVLKDIVLCHTKALNLAMPPGSSEKIEVLDEDMYLVPSGETGAPIYEVDSLVGWCICLVNKQGAFVYPWLRQEDACTVRWNFPETPGEKLRYNTFKTLWEQGHFITPGQKFGGDFLVYPGDPVKFHAQFLIICVERTSALPMSEIVAFGRLGSSVRKTVVIASTSSDQKSVIFQSINWSGT